MSRTIWSPKLGDEVLQTGTVVINGATPVSITGLSINRTSRMLFSLNTVGGTVGAIPVIQTITPQVNPGDGSVTVAGTASDTSTYNWIII